MEMGGDGRGVIRELFFFLGGLLLRGKARVQVNRHRHQEHSHPNREIKTTRHVKNATELTHAHHQREHTRL